MANNTVTILSALQTAASVPAETWETIAPGMGEALTAKFAAMAAQEAKKRESAKKTIRVKSKEQREREERAKVAAEIMAEHGEPVTSDWLMVNVPGLLTPSQAGGLMTTAINLGLVRKVDKVKVNGSTRVRYEAVPTEEQ